MKKHCVRFHTMYVVLFVLSLIFGLAGCSTAWTSEASSIIGLLVPAIQAALGILAAFGAGISPDVMTSFDSWAQQAQAALQNVVAPLIEKYNSALASAQPGILSEIETALQTVSSGLAQILPTIHITDPAKQQQIADVITAISDEITALISLIPALQGKVTSSEDMKALMEKVGYKSPKQFKKDFNAKVEVFGTQYQIK